MKLIRTSAVTATLLALVVFPVQAQTDRPGIPALINYQSFITDASNRALGVANGTNYDVQFKIWSAGTGGTLLWAEKQTVTIAAGQMSVLLGNGTLINGSPRPNLDALFAPGGTTAATLQMFLELTVNTVGQTTAAPFTPRQQLVANPFALRAKAADSALTVAAGGITSAALAAGSVSGGTQGAIADNSITAADIANATITGAKLAAGTVTSTQLADASVNTAELVDGAITTNKIADGMITSGKIADGTITSADIFDGTIGVADLNGAVGFWNRTGNNAFWNTGNVGIGLAAPVTPLHLKSAEEAIRIEGGAAGSANTAYLTFRDSTATRIGYVGDGATGNSDVLLVADSGAVVLMGAAGVKLGPGLYATGGEENLRIVRGHISTTGTILSGTGYSILKIPAVGGVPPGLHRITFSPPFTNLPVITTSAFYSESSSVPANATVVSVTASMALVQTYRGSDRADNVGINFIAAGPR